MKRLSWAFAPVVVAVLLFAAGPIDAASKEKETEVVRNAVEVLEDISAIPEKGIPPALLQNAHGIAVVPGVIKVGFVVGGRHGRGVVLVRDDRGGWSN
ncbi:MAG: lipid-binding SYLF domain-containing protein, partial [Candidatus Deferrimicrobiaceae bacterium]